MSLLRPLFFSFASKDASFWRPLSVLQYLQGVRWWTARCWMESDVLPRPHGPGKERKGMEGDGMACHESECWVFGSKCTGAMPWSWRWPLDIFSFKITDLEALTAKEFVICFSWVYTVSLSFCFSRSQRCRRLHRCGYTVPRALLEETRRNRHFRDFIGCI